MDSSKRNMDLSLLLLLPNNIPTINGSYGNRVIKFSHKKFIDRQIAIQFNKSNTKTEMSQQTQ